MHSLTKAACVNWFLFCLPSPRGNKTSHIADMVKLTWVTKTSDVSIMKSMTTAVSKSRRRPRLWGNWSHRTVSTVSPQPTCPPRKQTNKQTLRQTGESFYFSNEHSAWHQDTRNLVLPCAWCTAWLAQHTPQCWQVYDVLCDQLNTT